MYNLYDLVVVSLLVLFISYCITLSCSLHPSRPLAVVAAVAKSPSLPIQPSLIANFINQACSLTFYVSARFSLPMLSTRHLGVQLSNLTLTPSRFSYQHYLLDLIFSSYLEQGPLDYDNIADDEHDSPEVDVSVLAYPWQLLHPGLAGGDAEHGDEGAVEDTKVLRRQLREVGNPQD